MGNSPKSRAALATPHEHVKGPDMTNELPSSTEADVKHLRADMAKLNKDLSSIGDTLKNLLRDGKREAVDGLSDAGERVRDEVKRRAQSVTKEIEEKPVAAALTAFGIGLVLGLLFGHRR